MLNDNEMSISENVGSMARYLAVVRAKPEYYRMKAHTEKLLKHIPIIGNELSDAAFDIKSALKRIIYSDSWFEDLGLHYIGPIDGHNIQQLCEAFEMAKKYDKPVLLHVNTLKGKGYDFAERSPEQFHGISKFDINTGEPLSSGTSFSSKFGDIMCRFASCDDRVCAITAAMSIGTGLDRFSSEHKDRFFDIGIAEEHAVAFALGLAKSGFIPVFAVYSTFLQRCFDQLLHDAALQKQKMVIAIDRAGFVGEDGETHQGVFDVSMLRSVPDITVYSPSSYEGLKHAMQQALYSESKLVAVRYPRGAQRAIPESIKPTFADFDVFGDENAEKAIITYGRTFSACAFAYEKLVNSGKSVKLIKLNRIIPVCEARWKRRKTARMSISSKRAYAAAERAKASCSTSRKRDSPENIISELSKTASSSRRPLSRSYINTALTKRACSRSSLLRRIDRGGKQKAYRRSYGLLGGRAVARKSQGNDKERECIFKRQSCI